MVDADKERDISLMQCIPKTNYLQRELENVVGDMLQLAGAVPFELTDGTERGTRCVRLYNAAGLDLIVVCDRAMSIGRCTYCGVPISLETAVKNVHPSYCSVQGTEWLRSWPGGLLNTCGLTQVGESCQDENEDLGLHGRILSLPAHNVCCNSYWKDNEYYIEVQGTVFQITIPNENICLKRTIRISLSSTEIEVIDLIENKSHVITPFMFLQHINLGFPFLQPGTTVHLPEHVTESKDSAPKEVLANAYFMEEPKWNYEEQVFYHDIKADENGVVAVTIKSPIGKQVTIQYKKIDYPILTHCKMGGGRHYGLAIEPSNCHVQGRLAERKRGTLQFLQPNELRECKLKIIISD